MNLRQLGEQGLLALIRRRFGSLAPPSPGGIGDDAALVPRPGRDLLVATDCLIEGRHFRREEPPYFLGRKALAVNISDIAAMGGRPTAFLLTLGLPVDLPVSFLDLLLEGMASGALEHEVPLIGGDTSVSGGGVVIAITILGRPGGPRRPALTRSGARPGDLVMVSGALGGSAAGRALLEAGWRAGLEKGGRRLAGARPPARRRARLPEGTAPLTARSLAGEALRRHLDPSPRVPLGLCLARGRLASAAIDLSDGLSLDLARLAQASRVGAGIMEPALPIAASARCWGPALGIDPARLALHGGEDYELLFTVPSSRRHAAERLGAMVIGTILPRRRGVVLQEAAGRERSLLAEGFDHFRTGSVPGR